MSKTSFAALTQEEGGEKNVVNRGVSMFSLCVLASQLGSYEVLSILFFILKKKISRGGEAIVIK